MNYNDLRDNVEKLSVDELKNMLNEYNKGIIDEQKYESLKLIIYELEYRRLSKYIDDVVDIKVILNYNYDIIWKISDEQIEKSIKFLKKNKIPTGGVLRWFPLLLSMENVYYIYKDLKEKNKSNDEIFKMLVSDIKNNLNNKIDDKYSKDKDFISFLLEIVKTINSRRKITDTYNKIMKEIIYDNDYALKYLK